MADGGILGIIQRKNPEREFEIQKQIGSGTYGEVYEVRYHNYLCEISSRICFDEIISNLYRVLDYLLTN